MRQASRRSASTFAAITLTAAFALPAAAPAAPAAAAPPMVLTCDGPIKRDMSLADVKAMFGAANVTHGVADGPEGETYPVTYVFARDPARKLTIIWMDDKARRGVSNVSVDGDKPGAWSGPGGIRIGSTLAAVEKANGRPFVIWGFEWDYGGRVGDWKAGALQSRTAGCSFTARFDPRPPSGSARALGDGEFSSTDPKMRADRPVVSEFSVGFADPNAE
jgi:hypothetical protein